MVENKIIKCLGDMIEGTTDPDIKGFLILRSLDYIEANLNIVRIMIDKYPFKRWRLRRWIRVVEDTEFIIVSLLED